MAIVNFIGKMGVNPRHLAAGTKMVQTLEGGWRVATEKEAADSPYQLVEDVDLDKLAASSYHQVLMIKLQRQPPASV